MLQAQNGRQFNLAAKVVRSFLEKKNVSLQHSEALQLVSQLVGYPNYEAAKASLEGTSKGLAKSAGTWRELAHAIGTLDESQLDRDVQVSQGCDNDGVSTYSRGCSILLAHDDRIAAGEPLFSSTQPVLLVEEFDPALESEDADRIRMQFEALTGESAGLADYEIKREGLAGAVNTLNTDYSIHINIGRYVAYSEAQQGFWNIEQGFVSDKASATGIADSNELPTLIGIPDLELVLYADAVDVNPDDNESDIFTSRGAPVSRYQWPARFAQLWAEVSVPMHELLQETKFLVQQDGYRAQIAEREHSDGAGRQLTLELFSADGVLGCRLVMALADGLKSCMHNAALLGVFLETAYPDYPGHSLNPNRGAETPFATEASYLVDELLQQKPTKLARELVIHANFKDGMPKSK